MMDNEDLWPKIARRIARIWLGKRILMQNRVPVVSFTFDDVPQSACRTGHDILERHGCRATYYACGGLTGRSWDNELVHTVEDLKKISEAGHEIGSHGYDHLSYQRLSARQIAEDLSKNREFFDRHGIERAGVNFAYPFGGVRPGVKRHLGRRFASSRGIQNKLNRGRLDLTLLAASPLYSRLWTEQSLGALLERTAATRAWCIFFTHGVTESPGAWGVTPALLDFAVRQAKQAGCTVLPVRNALGLVGFRPADHTK